MNHHHSLITDLIESFTRFQGIGTKSAQRLIFQLLSWDTPDIQKFASIIGQAATDIDYCSQCFNFSEKNNLCNICSNPQRNTSVLCIVPTIKELMTIERIGTFRGQYHVLHGIISPLDGIVPDDLKIKELITRVHDNQDNIDEIIIALSPSTEGEATTLYISKFLKEYVSKITRLAFGLSVGADIDQTDELTLNKAFEGRLKI